MIEKISYFKEILKDEKNDIVDIINKNIIFGVPYIFKDDEEKYYNLKRKLSSFFKVNHRDIFMVGSAKLGFSISPKKLWNQLDWDSKKESDIDMVVISNKAFDKYWKSILEYKEKTIGTSVKDEKEKEFLDYFFNGWLRPDKFPQKYKGSDEWFDFFRSISYKEEFGGRKIAVAIYREDYFFMKYHRNNLVSIRNNLRNERRI
ncbi:hypothetical protein IZY60_04425 [Lutibacter sp. B2]|nr:hypothetical protein [Lutibacter sp. B2]